MISFVVRPWALLLGVVVLAVIASAWGLRGPLPQHAGTGALHLYSAAINASASGGIHAAEVRTDGTVQPYNHHPPLHFFLNGMVARLPALLGLADTYANRLQAGYLFAAVLTAAGLCVLVGALIQLGFSPLVATLAATSLLGVRMLVVYRAFLTFDGATLLMASLLLLAVARFHNQPVRRRWWAMTGAFVAALSVAWYAIAATAVYTLQQGLAYLRRRRFKSALVGHAAQTAFVAALFTVLLAGLLTWQETRITHQPPEILASLNRASGNGAGLALTQSTPVDAYRQPAHVAFMLVRRVAETLPLHLLAVLPVLLFVAFRRQGLQPVVQVRGTVPALTTLAGGTALFIAATPVWSSIHPFAYLWFLPVVAWVVAAALQALQTQKILFGLAAAAVLAGSFGGLAWATLRDQAFATRTAPLIELADITLPHPSALDYHFNIGDGCGGITFGPLMYLASAPNRTAAGQDVPAPYTRVVVECVDDGLVFQPVLGTAQAAVHRFALPRN